MGRTSRHRHAGPPSLFSFSKKVLSEQSDKLRQSFHDWYARRWCGHSQIDFLHKIQNCLTKAVDGPTRVTSPISDCRKGSSALSSSEVSSEDSVTADSRQHLSQGQLATWCARKYFGFWTELGDAFFYSMLIPVVIWLHLLKEAYALTVFMGLNLLATQFFKDMFYLARPPCPPLWSRGGKHSHEYGFPSTHSALTCCLVWEIFQIIASVNSGAALHTAETLNVVVGITSNASNAVMSGGLDVTGIDASSSSSSSSNFLVGALLVFCGANIVFSRIYLGMHWIGDVVGGFLVFACIAVLESLFLRNVVMSLVDGSMGEDVPLWLPLYLGHVVLLWMPVPKTPCPCYEDGARFSATVTGSTIGYWLRRAWEVPVVSYTRSEQVWGYLASWAFWKRYAFGIVILGIAKSIAGTYSPVVLRPIHKFWCGVYAGDIRNSSIRRLYVLGCVMWGVLLIGKTDIRFPSKSSSSLFFSSSKRSVKKKKDANEASPVVGVAAEDGWKGFADQDLEDPFFSASAVLLPSPATLPDDSPLLHQLRGEGGGREGRHRSRWGHQLWSLRNHRFWFEWDIHSKYINYWVGSLLAVLLIPVIQNAVFGEFRP